MKVKNIALTLATTALLLYAGICVYLYATQRSLLYFPTPEEASSVARPFYLENGTARLKIWEVVRPGAGAVIYFGGNADAVARHIDHFAPAIADRSLYFVNYRGYGGSSGRPSERRLFSDALAVFDEVKRRHGNVAVIGRSLGSGVAGYVATQRPVEKLVLVTPYDSIERVAQGHYRWFPIFLILKDRFDTLGRVKKIAAPTMIVIAEMDEVIPRERTEALVRAFPQEQLTVEVLPGVGHDLGGDSQSYLATLRDFLAR